MRALKNVAGVSALMLVLFGCGSDGGGSGPGGGFHGDPVAAGSSALADAYAATVAIHAPTYSSVHGFGPRIARHFASLKLASAKGLPVCVPAEIADTVFVYDLQSTSYAATAAPGAPAGGVRFELYEVDENGDPLEPLVPAGHFDVACDPNSGAPIVEVSNADGQNVFSMGINMFWMNPPEYILGVSEGTLFDDGAGHNLGTVLTAQGTLYEVMQTWVTLDEGFEFYLAEAANYRATSGLWDTSLDDSGSPVAPYFAFGAGGSQYDGPGTEANQVWHASVGGSVTDEGILLNIVQGDVAPLEFEHYTELRNGVLACFSGDYRNPLVESATAGCPTGVIDTPIPLDAAELTAIHDGYVAMAEILESMSVSLAAVLPMVVR